MTMTRSGARSTAVSVIAFISFLIGLPALASAAPARLPGAPARLWGAPVRPGLYFEANAGQTDASVRFLLRGQLGTFFFTPAEVVLASSTGAPLRVQFLGADPAVRVEGAEPRSGTVN